MAAAYALVACAPAQRSDPAPAPIAGSASRTGAGDEGDASARVSGHEPVVGAGRPPVAPPTFAARAGLMPLRTTGVDRFHSTHPTYDGRGVLIAILDTGVDPTVDGLQTTSLGEPKIVDIRDFSREGRVALAPVSRRGDTLEIAGARLAGANRVASTALGNSPWYGGWIDERAFGPAPGGDLDGDGSGRGRFGVAVVRTLAGWVAFLDLDGDGTVADETALQDFLVARTTFTFARDEQQRGHGPIGAALNLAERDGVPVVDLVVDNAGHGTHVAGVAAGNRIGKVPGFDGVAPGAQLLALKIADNARGGITVSGSMLAAMEYSARFAEARHTPLIINVSFGIGNGTEGRAVIDSAVNAFLARHPNVVCTISAGNDGPGLSTVGFPGSSDLALSVGAVYPAAFLSLVTGREAGDALADFSARGAEVAKPDLVAPGVAYSTVPRWNAGEEIKGGTSFAAPHVAGMAALLMSAAMQDARSWSAATVREALIRAAKPLGHGNALDQGAGIPDAARAWSAFASTRESPRILVRAVPMGGNASLGASAFRRAGFAGRGDTLQSFTVVMIDRGERQRVRLESDAAWIDAPASVWLSADSTTVAVRYIPERAPASEVAVGRVWARSGEDAGAAPLFALTSVVARAVSLEEGPVAHQRREVAAGAVARHFVLVPPGAGGLAVKLVRRGLRWPTVAVFEPSGRPAPASPAVTDSAVFIRAEDLVAGVYEIVVVGSATAATVYDLEAALAPVVKAVVRGDTVAVAGERVAAYLAGAELRWTVEGRGAAPLRRGLRVPKWATTMEIDVAMPASQWNRFTDCGVTVFNARGERISADPLSYPRSRTTLRVDSLAGAEVTLELFPGLALVGDDAPWAADVTVRALVPEQSALPAAGAGRFVASSSLSAADEPGWHPLVEAVVREASGPAGVERVAVGGR